MSKENNAFSYTAFNEVDADPLFPNKHHGMNKRDAEVYLEYLAFLSGKKKLNGLTRFDAYAIRGDVEREDLKNLLYEETRTRNEDDLLRRLNSVYSGAIEAMEDTIGLKIPNCDKGKIWESVDDFIDFMYSTGKKQERGGYLRVARCAILKTMSAYNQVLDNDDLMGLEEHAHQFIQAIKGMEGIHNVRENGEGVVFDCTISLPQGGTYVIKNNKLKYRVKERIKILIKLLGNRKYLHYDELTDLIGLNIEVGGGNREIEDLMEHFYCHTKHAGCEMDNKGGVSPDFSERSGIPVRKKMEESGDEDTDGATLVETKGPQDALGRKGKRRMSKEASDQRVGIKKEASRPSTASGYTNACLYMLPITSYSEQAGKIPTVEIQYVPKDHKNDLGYRDHLILDAKKIITVIAREIGYCTASDIKRIVADVADEIEEKTSVQKEDLMKWIIRHMLEPESGKEEGYLIRIQTEEWGGGPIYTTKDVLNDPKIFKAQQKRFENVVTFRPVKDDGRIDHRVNAIYKAA